MTGPSVDPAAGRSGRGQTATIAVVLLIAVVAVGSTSVVVFGSDALDLSERQMRAGSAANAMTQFDATASLVAHGDADSRTVGLPSTSSSTVTVQEDRGWMNVTLINASDGTVNATVMNETLGAVVYENGDTRIVYQGGAVMRNHSDGGTTVVTPPEFHFRAAQSQDPTLSLPLVTVNGSGSLNGGARITVANETWRRFPNGTLSNPLTEGDPYRGGQINVTVHSEYYRTWGEFFEQRTAGNVVYDHDDETVTVEMVVPFDENFDNAVATQSPGGITDNGGANPSPQQTGVPYPSVDDRIEDEISECQSGGCTSYPGGNPTLSPPSDTTYWPGANTDVDDNSITFDTSDANISLVVDGQFAPGDVEITGENNVTIYVRDTGIAFELSGGDTVNEDPDSGDAGRLTTLVHSDGDVDFGGNYKYVGLLYAPDSDVTLGGGGGSTTNLVGGVVADTMTLNGDPNDFEYDSSIQGIDIGLTGSNAAEITYLHVSSTTLNVTST